MGERVERETWVASMKEIFPGVWVVVLRDAGGWHFASWKTLRGAAASALPLPAVEEPQRSRRFDTEEEAFAFFQNMYRDHSRAGLALRE